MNWIVLLLLFMLYVLIKEVLQFKKRVSKRDNVVFLSLWAITLGVLIAEWRGYPVIRPLDWIRTITGPLNRWLG